MNKKTQTTKKPVTKKAPVKKVTAKKKEVVNSEVINPEDTIKIVLDVEKDLKESNPIDIAQHGDMYQQLGKSKLKYLFILKCAFGLWIIASILSTLNIVIKVTDTDYMTMAYNHYLALIHSPLPFDDFVSQSSAAVMQQMIFGMLVGAALHYFTYRQLSRTQVRVFAVLTISICAFGLIAKMNTVHVDALSSSSIIFSIFADLAISIILIRIYSTISKMNYINNSKNLLEANTKKFN